MIRTIVGLYCTLLSLTGVAETTEGQMSAPMAVETPAIGQPVTGGSILELTLGLIFIILLIFTIAWFIKRFSIFHPVASDKLKVVAGIHLGQREKILLVQVGEEQILVGLTATDIRTLHVLESPLPIQDSKTIKNGEFAKHLSSLMDNFKGKS